MAYLTGRVFRDGAGYIYREHRTGWFRRDGADETPLTEHPFSTLKPLWVSEWVDRGTLIIEEEPDPISLV